MKSVKEAAVSGKRVIVRCDFDVPIKNGKIVDGTRINDSIPTLRYLLEKGAKLFLISKMGRPKFRDSSLSLKLVAEDVSKNLKAKVSFKEDLSDNVPGDVTLLENLRFWPEEKASDLEFSKKIASFGDIYVNECFATSHRSDASLVGVPKYLPSYAGLHLTQEVYELKKIFKDPKRPLISIIGGDKIETKLPAITNLAKVSDKVLVGGKLMFELGGQRLPENVVVASDDIDGKDIGPKSTNSFSKIIQAANTIVWNGPRGMFEVAKYTDGTKKLAQSIVESSAHKAVGSGDTISALDKLKLLDKIDYVSSGGGAMLEFLAGKKLPGLVALNYYND